MKARTYPVRLTLQLVGSQQFAMADVEDALVGVHVCPVGTASLLDAELC